MKKKTHEEYVTELTIKNPNVEVIGQYINANTKIMHHCLIHDVFWNTTPSRVLNGCGCEMCRKEKFHQTKTKTHEEYTEELKMVNPNIEVIDKYIDMKTPILHRCNKHNIEWKTIPSSILYYNCGCTKCGSEKIIEKNSKTHEQYIKELKTINPNIEVIGTYKGANTPILHKCKIDEYEWNATPANILYGKGCPKCANNLQRTHIQYVEELKNINPDIEPLEEYINIKTPILHRCKKHNILWTSSPVSILQGSGCFECWKEKLREKHIKSNEQYINELAKINPNIIAIEKYINSLTPILHKCLIDNNEWYVAPSRILFGNGCPQCNESKGERRIRMWLNNHDITYESQKKFENCRDVKSLPFDFYLPNYNLCIEYQGEQHYRSIEYFGGKEKLEYIQKHDNIKNEYCKQNGISLLCIPYYKYKNIEEELNNFLFI